ncbi:putative spore protein YtfJ [Koleobacter methoxysyntrophicus]|jgi:sporulation protein YtfJ|uniref:Putative spore protein YtfJ n=1 Tax=Koleobacter methoxysyntrophicus TaxID=2751313 RepID=A0A8A0RRF5_9FIRM|nr:GerW family sporulation protein [Koleobacter methoxysyntrophicus]QSQ10098.1 putative spore protein YtfJ [Koleobacter methoxysyntrophicus]
MSDHPIQGLMKTAMESIKEMVDVNTIVGDAVETPDGSVIIPVSRVTFGFAAGGAEYEINNGAKENLPFGGGSGAGVTLQPVAFVVVGQGQIRLLATQQNTAIERIIDIVPQLMDKINNMICKEKRDNQLNH